MYAVIRFDEFEFEFGNNFFSDKPYLLYNFKHGFEISEFANYLRGRLPRHNVVPDICFYLDGINGPHYPMPNIFYGKYRRYSRVWFYQFVNEFVECAKNISTLESIDLDRTREYWNLCNDLGKIIPICQFEQYDIQEYPSDLEAWGFELLKDTAESAVVVRFINNHYYYIDAEDFALDVIRNDYTVTCPDPVTGLIYIYRD